jgi:hypothetical protein
MCGNRLGTRKGVTQEHFNVLQHTTQHHTFSLSPAVPTTK